MLCSCVLVYSVNDKCACVCVESELLGVFSSSLLCLLFAANMATDTLSSKSPLKAQPPSPSLPRPHPPHPWILSGSHSYITLSESWIRIGLLLPSLTVHWKSALHITVNRACLIGHVWGALWSVKRFNPAVKLL